MNSRVCRIAAIMSFEKEKVSEGVLAIMEWYPIVPEKFSIAALGIGFAAPVDVSFLGEVSSPRDGQ